MAKTHRWTQEEEFKIALMFLRGNDPQLLSSKLNCGVSTIYKVAARNKKKVFEQHPELAPAKLDDVFDDVMNDAMLKEKADARRDRKAIRDHAPTASDFHNVQEVKRWEQDHKNAGSKDEKDIAPPDLKGDGIYVTEWRDGVLWMQNPNNPDEWLPEPKDEENEEGKKPDDNKS